MGIDDISVLKTMLLRHTYTTENLSRKQISLVPRTNHLIFSFFFYQVPCYKSIFFKKKSRRSYRFIFYCFLYTSILKRGLEYKCIQGKDFSVSFKWKICPSNPSLNMLIINSRLPSLAYIECIEPTSPPPVCVPGDLDGHAANTIVFQSLLYYRKLLLILAVQCSLSFFWALQQQ